MEPFSSVVGSNPSASQRARARAEAEADADEIVANALARRRRAEANRQMLHGSLWFVGGLGLTVWTLAAQPGGRGAVFIGAIVVGLIKFFRGATMM